MKTLQEKLDESAIALEPILWELLNEIEENKWVTFLLAVTHYFGFLLFVYSMDPIYSWKANNFGRGELSTGCV